MTIAEIKMKVHDFLHSKVDPYRLNDDEDIFASGLVNSLLALEIVTYLERTFSIEVESEDMDIDNFRTINAISHFVENKMG